MIRGISLLKGMLARLAALFLLWPVLALAQAPDFVEFESGQVRPLAMSADGTRLFAVNTPNNALEIFSISASGLTLQARVPVGLEPVAEGVEGRGWIGRIEPQVAGEVVAGSRRDANEGEVVLDRGGRDRRQRPIAPCNGQRVRAFPGGLVDLCREAPVRAEFHDGHPAISGLRGDPRSRPAPGPRIDEQRGSTRRISRLPADPPRRHHPRRGHVSPFSAASFPNHAAVSNVPG